MIYHIAGNFCQFRHLLLLAKFYIHELLFCVNDYIEDMATFTALVKFIPVNTSASWAWRNFYQAKIFGYSVKIMQYHITHICPGISNQRNVVSDILLSLKALSLMDKDIHTSCSV